MTPQDATRIDTFSSSVMSVAFDYIVLHSDLKVGNYLKHVDFVGIQSSEEDTHTVSKIKMKDSFKEVSFEDGEIIKNRIVPMLQQVIRVVAYECTQEFGVLQRQP